MATYRAFGLYKIQPVRWLAGQLICGNLLYLGLALVLIGFVMRIWRSENERRLVKWLHRLISLGGWVAVVVSVSCVNIWWAGWLVILIGLWLFAGRLRNSRLAVTATVILLAIVPFLQTRAYETGSGWPKAPLPKNIYIIGDSITAGVTPITASIVKHEQQWPELIAPQLPARIIDLSGAGARVSWGLKVLDSQERAKYSLNDIDVRDSLVIIELGGNDFLHQSSVSQYAEQLDDLLRQLQANNNTVVMFDVPCPPHKPAFGWVQRRIATKHRVRLIPRRVMGLVMFEDHANTSDGLHLSQAGQHALADHVMRWLGDWFQFQPPADR